MPRGVWLAPCFYRNPSAPRLSAELPTGMDTIEFTTDIVPSDVTLVQNGNDFIVRINGTSDQITVKNHFVSADYRIEQLRFADGTIWNATAISTWLVTNGANTPT